MDTINDHMTADHRRCDAIFEEAERAARAGDLAVLARASSEFLSRITAHIAVEERLLFPAFEERTGMRGGGPTAVMTAEHRAMEALFDEMRAAVAGNDADAYLRASGQMMEILDQHNQKEEMMMYPMLDRVMGGDLAPLLSEVRQALPLVA